jgi:TonB family protein
VNARLESDPLPRSPAPASYRLLVEAERSRRRRQRVTTVVAVAVTALAFWAAPQEAPLSELNARRFGYFGPTRLVPDIEVRREQDSERREPAPGSAFQTVSLAQDPGSAETGAPNPEGPAAGEMPRLEQGLQGTAEEELRQVEIPVVQSTDVVIEHLVEPSYPKQGRDLGLEARVVLAALVDERGHVLYIRVLENTGHPMFEDAAKEALRKCIFRPYTEAGRAAKVWVRYPVRFDIIETEEERIRAKELLD